MASNPQSKLIPSFEKSKRTVKQDAIITTMAPILKKQQNSERGRSYLSFDGNLGE